MPTVPSVSNPVPAWPASVAAALWRGSDLGASTGSGTGRTLPSGHAALDEHLPGGGWPCGALTELLAPPVAPSPWRLIGPALALAANAGRAGPVLLIGPPQQPHLPGLCLSGLAAAQFIWVDVQRQADRLWALEQALKANAAAALVAWLPQARPDHLRRLQVCAQRSEAPVFVLRPAAAQHEPSAAPLRLRWQADAQGMGLAVQILKRRGLPHEGWITLQGLPGPLQRVVQHRLAAGRGVLPEEAWAGASGAVVGAAPEGERRAASGLAQPVPVPNGSSHELLVGPAAAPGRL